MYVNKENKSKSQYQKCKKQLLTVHITDKEKIIFYTI